MSTPAQTSRQVAKIVLARETPEGVGVTVRRSIGSFALRNLDPFLLLDHFSVQKGSGFGEHPHRGFSTITYMLDGAVQHEDFKGHKGVIRPGDVQWMFAGKGILHSEMPVFEGDDTQPAVGMQLWLNAKKGHKLDPPEYQEFSSGEMPYAHPSNDVTIKVISGEMEGSAEEGLVKSLIKPSAGASYFDVSFKKVGARHFAALPPRWTSFLYVLEGSVNVGGAETVEQYHVAVLSADDGQNGVSVEALSDDARVVLVAGEPIGEPVVQHGPFVMNTKLEIQQAMMDFQLGRNGFEGASEWRSKSAAALQ